MDDCVIVGAGIIGMSLASELQRQGLRVRILDRGPARHVASWAAAGILPPPIRRALHDPLEQIRDLSHRLYEPWCRRLAMESGVDVPYHRCGGIYVGRTAGERVSLAAALEQWESDGVEVQAWTADRLRHTEPNLRPLPSTTAVYFLPEEVLVRPPRIVRALRERLRGAGVAIHTQVEFHGWDDAKDSMLINTSIGTIRARHFCITAGAWTPDILRPLGFELPVEPRRGQIVMWRLDEPIVRHVINEGPRYLVPRPDGHLLVGSTVEDVGFQDDTTPAAVAELVRFARGLVAQLAHIEPVSQWAGLRPASLDGKPYLGRVPGHDRITVATGHFRSGIHLAPATALLMTQLICDEPTDLDLSEFAPTR